MHVNVSVGVITVRSEASGGETSIADIVRSVEGAQARTAPVQRTADTVAGKFAFAVMGLSAATFAFWATAGATMFPSVVAAGGASGSFSGLLLPLQLACNVLVVACPCALGLATPTAVLVGTSAAAKRGLLVRGGDVIERMSHIDTVVFDKTGTLTEGKPSVVDVCPVASGTFRLFLCTLCILIVPCASPYFFYSSTYMFRAAGARLELHNSSVHTTLH